MTDGAELARALYAALAAGDAERLATLLHPDFTGRTTEGLPFDLGGSYVGPDAMARDFWWAIGRRYRARAEPERFVPLADGVLVLGRYVGTAREGGGTLDAAFAHVLGLRDGRIASVEQYTDSARWHAALAAPTAPDADTTGPVPAGRRPLRVIDYRVDGAVATIRLNRPEAGNGIDPTLVEDLYECAFRAGADPTVRAVVLCGAGDVFTVGGDLAMFGALDRAELPHRLRQMIDVYHLALERLAEIDAPVVAAVRGAVAGGGLGMMHVADLVIAADDTSIALGYAAIGLASDGFNSWYLPRVVGMRRAQEMFLCNRRLTGAEAQEWGLVTETRPADEVEPRARELADRLAAGPTQAFGRMRRLLRQSFETDLSTQGRAEVTEMTAAGASDDAAEGVPAFRARRRPTFRGR